MARRRFANPHFGLPLHDLSRSYPFGFVVVGCGEGVEMRETEGTAARAARTSTLGSRRGGWLSTRALMLWPQGWWRRCGQEGHLPLFMVSLIGSFSSRFIRFGSGRLVGRKRKAAGTSSKDGNEAPAKNSKPRKGAAAKKS